MSAPTQERHLRARTDMFVHQEKAIDQIQKRPNLLLFLKPGGGKTAATLTAGPFPMMIVAPVRVCETVWAQEAAEWEHLSHLRFSLLRGTPKVRLSRLEEQADVYLINYDLLSWLMGLTPQQRGRLDGEDGPLSGLKALVFDEVSMMKAPGTKRFRAIRRHLANVPRRLGLTGTPTGNSLMNLFGEAFAVASDAPFGNSFTTFKHTYFYTVDPQGFIWRPKHGSKKKILDLIKPWTSYIRIPPAAQVLENPIRVPLPAKARKAINELTVRAATEIEGHNIFAMNDLALKGKLRQLCSGAIYSDLNGAWDVLHDAKLDALADLVEELEGAPLLVFYEFQHELIRIKLRIDGVQELSSESIKLWNKGKVPVLALHPQSGAHGLNLQHGGSDIAWFTLPWSWELWKQGIGRLARPGQRERVTVHTLLAAGTIDEDVRAALTQHGQVETETLTAANPL